MEATLRELDGCQDTDLRSLVAEMREEISQLRREVSELRCEAGHWKRMHARAVERNIKLQAELDQAHAEIRRLKADLFGRKSEKQPSPDRSNDLDDPQDRRRANKKKRGQQPGRPGPARRDYSHLPVREEFIDLGPEASVCGRCGKPLADLGQTQDSEQVEIELVVYRRRIRRRRYRQTCNCPGPQTRTAATPPKLIPKGRYGNSLWVHLLLEKFHSGRPIQRTIDQLRLYGLQLAAGTIADGLKRMAPLLEPIYAALVARNVQSAVHHADETRWLVFTEKQGKRSHRWWLWVFAGEDTVVYALDPTRSHEVPEGHFPPDAEGVLIVDRYSAYKAMQQVQQGKLILAFCCTHVRRDFVRVGKGYPELKDWALSWLRSIRELYRLHRERHQHDLSSPEYAAIDARLRTHMAAMGQRRDAELADPGRLATMTFSILATLKLWKINPRLWLSWYLKSCASARGKPPSDIEPFLPWSLADERRAALADPPPAPEAADSS